MVDETVYVVIGAIMVTCFVAGGAMLANQYSPPEIRGAGSFLILGGFVLLLILLGMGGYQLWKWYSGWSLERRSDELDRKMEKIRIKEREDEVKNREREYREEKRRKEESKNQSTSTGTRSAQPYQPPTNQPVQETKTESKSPTQNLKKTEQVSDESILKTGGGVPSNLQEKTEELESHEILEPIEKDSEQEEYVRHVKMDPILRSLWYLYNSKEGFFLGQTEAARIIYEIEEGDEVSGSRRQEVKASMRELQHYALITETVVKGDIRGKKLIEYKITPKGKDLMKRAVEGNVRKWVDFVEKYRFEMKG